MNTARKPRDTKDSDAASSIGNVLRVLGRSTVGTTRPFICLGDDGVEYFVKGRSAGPKGLAAEWVSGRLGAWLGLPMPDSRILTLDQAAMASYAGADVQDLGGGPLFGSSYISDLAELRPSMLQRIPVLRQQEVLAFDLWVHNEDRTLLPTWSNPNLGWSRKRGGLVVFDHNRAFEEGFGADTLMQRHVFRNCLERGWDMEVKARMLEGFDSALSRLDDIWQAVPSAWKAVATPGAGPSAGGVARMPEQASHRGILESQTMNTDLACNFAVLQFRPHRITREFVNLGVVLMAVGEPLFGYRMETRRQKRVTAFFPELDIEWFREARLDVEEDLRWRMDWLTTSGLSAFASPAYFRELTRPSEDHFHYSEPGLVLTRDFQATLNQLFDQYVNRQFQVQKEYQEMRMAREVGGWFRDNDLLDRYKVNGLIGNEHYHVRMPFLSLRCEAGIHLRAIKPLDLDRPAATAIYEHGDAWVNRLRRLREQRALPRELVFGVRSPHRGATQMRASEEIVKTLHGEFGAVIVPYEDKAALLAKAAEAA